MLRYPLFNVVKRRRAAEAGAIFEGCVGRGVTVSTMLMLPMFGSGSVRGLEFGEPEPQTSLQTPVYPNASG